MGYPPFVSFVFIIFFRWWSSLSNGAKEVGAGESSIDRALFADPFQASRTSLLATKETLAGENVSA